MQAGILAAAGIIYYKMGGPSIYWNIDVSLTAMPFFYAGYLCRKIRANTIAAP